MKKFTTVAECLTFLGLEMPTENMFPADDRAHTIADYLLKRVIKAHIQINFPGWVADATNRTIDRYYNWFKIIKYDNGNSGFEVSNSLFDHWLTYSTVGSRLEMPSREICAWIREQYKDLYLLVFLPEVK